MNLVYVIKDRTNGAAEDWVGRLAAEHPSRTLLVRLDDESNPPVQAPVTWQYRRPLLPPQPSSDFIVCHAAGSHVEGVLSTLLSLCLPGLPTALVWDTSLPPDHPLLKEIAARVHRVIVSVIPPCGPASSLRNLLSLQNRLGANVLVTDVAESMYGGWQAAMVKLLDTIPGSARSIRLLEMRCADEEVTAEMLYVTAWIAAALNWTALSFAWRAEGMEILFAGEGRALLRAVPSLVRSEIEIQHAVGRDVRRLSLSEPSLEIRWEELLRKQLRIWNQDPLRAATLERVAEYLDAMEMPTRPPEFGHV
jgi:glucose-6-phosphate dehydrogenase assembly protein OpcA